jgi:hypothetical protein
MKPHVFVSSTFYDLKQVRDDIRQFLDALGYQALLSEYSSFPVDPSRTAVENCREQVEREADIFVLVVGTRYGEIDKASLKSVTNLEYLAARAKRIPIYAFIDKTLDPLLRLWAANPSTDLSTLIESPALLQFVREVRSTDGVWSFWFERASDITNALCDQFAHLMSQGLQWRHRANSAPEVRRMMELGGRSLRLALERPNGWEHYLLAQVIEDEINRARDLRDEHREQFALELGEDVRDPFEWSSNRMKEILRLIASLTPLLRVCAQRAIGPHGTPGDVDDLIFVGQSIGRVYVAILKWSRRVRTANVHDDFEPVRAVLAKFTDEPTIEMEAFGPRCRGEIDRAVAIAATGASATFDMTLTLRVSDELMDEFSKALADAARSMRSSQSR